MARSTQERVARLNDLRARITHCRFFIRALLFLAVCPFCSLASNPLADKAALQADRQALLEIKAAFNNHPAFEEYGKWIESDNKEALPCQDGWRLITCNKAGRVNGISIDSQVLALANPAWAKGGSVGPLSSEIPWDKLGGLSELATVSLKDNLLYGPPIKPDIANLTQLAEIYMQDNLLSGPIDDSLSTATSITTLFLDGNQLTGGIPEGIGNLTALQTLDLSGNQMWGPLLPSLSECNQLQFIDFSSNFFYGALPKEWKSLTRLQILNLNNNSLTGTMPSEWSRMKSLQNLILFKNNLTGPFPDFLPKLQRIKSIILSDNLFYGFLPSNLWNPSSLGTVDISYNYFSSKVPKPPASRNAGFSYEENCLTVSASEADLQRAPDACQTFQISLSVPPPPPSIFPPPPRSAFQVNNGFIGATCAILFSLWAYLHLFIFH